MSRSVIAARGLSLREPWEWRALARTADAVPMPLDDLAVIIGFEASHDAAAQNSLSHATGLIQWMPEHENPHGMTWTGMTADVLKTVPYVQQLPFVLKWFREKHPPFAGLVGAYMAVFMPAYAHADPDTVIARRGSKAYDQNKHFDVNDVGFFTVRDVGAMIEGARDVWAKRPRIEIPDAPPSSSSSSGAGGGAAELAGLAALVGALWRWG